MAVSRKRKHAATDDQPANKHTSHQLQQTGMKAFVGVSKPQNYVEGMSKRKKTLHQREATPPAITISKPMPAKADKKRKRGLESVAEEEQTHEPQQEQGGFFKKFAATTTSVTTETPRNKRFRTAALPPSPKETPSKNAAALFDKLKLSSVDTAIPFALDKKAGMGYDTPPATPEAEVDTGLLNHVALPGKLQDFCELHAAFLTALSLYYAHNGTSSPVNVSNLLQMVTNTWRKAAVTLEDLRRLLASAQSDFTLEDYGRAGVCLARKQARGRALKRAASYVDEDDLNARFSDALLKQWVQWQACTGKENHDASTFLAQLPLSDIVQHKSAESAAPLFARGQARLADLKAAQLSALQATTKPTAISDAQEKTSQAVLSRGTSLLDRILAKQILSASLPSGPTKLQLERRAALHRIEDIARTLDMLAGAKARITLSMPAMVQQLQQSLRNPISREEVEQCLGLMASEITPGFVRVVESGAVKAVVVCRGARVGVEELRERVAKACA